MNISFQQVTLIDLYALREIGYQTYDESFRNLNTSENMDAYLNSAFDLKKLQNELSDPNCIFFFLYKNSQLAGYLKINENESQTDIKDKNSLELERIYIKKEFQGQGLGRLLIDKGLEVAREKNKKMVWLGVWEKNTNAIGFYEKMGFKKTTTHNFYMGDEKQTDHVMKLYLN